jgi:hypothetical protein
MSRSTRAALARTVIALAVTAGAGTGLATASAATTTATTAAAAAPEAVTTGWIVENPHPDDLFETRAGAASIVDSATGATISCAAVDGIGRADSGTIRPNDWFGATIMTTYTSCTGPAGSGIEVFSPEIRMVPTTYDPVTDSLSGFAIVDIWGLFPTAPGCDVTLYATNPLYEAPMTYDNGTSTIDIGPVTAEVYEATGPDCSAFPPVGGEMTFETTLVASPGFTVRPA